MTQTPHRDAVGPAASADDLATHVGPFWSAEKVCAELNLEFADLQVLVSAGAVLGLETADKAPVLLFAVAQFERSAGETRVRPGIRAMLRELQDDDMWSIALVLTTPAPELGDRSTYEAAKHGTDPHDLVDFARLIHAEWR